MPHPEVNSQCGQDTASEHVGVLRLRGGASEAMSYITPVLQDAGLTCAAEVLAEQTDVFATSFDELCPSHQLLWSAFCVGLEGTIIVDQVEFNIPNLFCGKSICVWNTDCSPGSRILFSRTRPALLRQVHQDSEPATNVNDVSPVLLAMPMIEVAMFSAAGAPAAYIDSGASMNISPDERLFNGTLDNTKKPSFQVVSCKRAVAKGVGTLYLKVLNSATMEYETLVLPNSACLPQCPFTLLSVNAMSVQGIATCLIGDRLYRFTDESKTELDPNFYVQITRVNGSFQVQLGESLTPPAPQVCN
jgi:hypothetical protein